MAVAAARYGEEHDESENRSKGIKSSSQQLRELRWKNNSTSSYSLVFGAESRKSQRTREKMRLNAKDDGSSKVNHDGNPSSLPPSDIPRNLALRKKTSSLEEIKENV